MVLQYVAFLVGAVTAHGPPGLGHHHGHVQPVVIQPVVAEPRVIISQPRVIIPQPRIIVPEPRVVVQPRVVVAEPRVVVPEPRVVVQPRVVVPAPKIVTTEVEHAATYEGPLLEKEFSGTSNVARRETVTHHPVYHKNIYNQFTEHDVVNRDVYHHLTEDEARHYDVEGKQIHAGEQHIDHGKVGHAAYGEILGQYGIAAPVIAPVLPVEMETVEYVRPVVATPKKIIAPVEVENFATFQGPLVETDFESTQQAPREAVTHHPVFHKNVYNQYTEHDVVNRDVYHHLTEDEARHYDVEGKQIYVGEQHIDHGKVGHAAYGKILGQYGTVTPVQPVGAYTRSGYQAYDSYNPVGRVSQSMTSTDPQFVRAESFKYADKRVATGPTRFQAAKSGLPSRVYVER